MLDQNFDWYLLRRTTVRALSTPSSYILSKPRSLTASSKSLLRSYQQPLSFRLQNRFASDDVESRERNVDENPETDYTSSTPPSTSADPDENSTISSAISSATSKVRDGASNAAEAVGGYARSAQKSVLDESYNDRPKSQALYVGNLFFDVTEEDLKREMERYGVVKSVKIIYDGRGLSKGYGWVEFDSLDASAHALEQMNGSIFQGRKMIVQYVREADDASNPRTRNPPSKCLFIGNMSFEMSDKDLNELFREIRNVLDVRVAIDRRSGQPRGFAHADFVDKESAMAAAESLREKIVHGRRLRIDFSQKAQAPSRGQMAGPEN
ncbi:MAG: hypothetical protein M1812_001578 [Candelaria pacifica]|nr:MAG: hypothetical protein M1812_001578 [Candelaria pacifica]